MPFAVSLVNGRHVLQAASLSAQISCNRPASGEMNEWPKLGRRKEAASGRDWVVAAAKPVDGLQPNIGRTPTLAALLSADVDDAYDA